MYVLIRSADLEDGLSIRGRGDTTRHVEWSRRHEECPPIQPLASFRKPFQIEQLA